MTSRVCLLGLGSLMLLGCIGKGTSEKKPVLTAADHEAAAAQAERMAAEQESRIDPGLYEVQRCAPLVVPPPNAQISPQNPPSFFRPEDPCGTSQMAAARDHQVEAERQRLVASRHRATAAEIRRNEEVACMDVPDEARAQNPLVQQGEVLAVRPLAEPAATGKAATRRSGVVVALDKPAGVDPERLERVMNCQAAMAAADPQPALKDSPAAVPGAKTSVWEDDGQLMVEITSSDEKVATEIGRRARALVGPEMPPATKP